VCNILAVRFCFAVVILVALAAGDASAHQFQHPKMLRLGVRADAILLSLTYDLNPGEDARMARSLFDRDGNGELDAGEREKLERYLEDTARLFLQVAIDGKEVTLERVELVASRLDLPRASSETLGIAAVYRAALPPGDRVSIRVADRDKDRARHVPLVVDLAPGWDVELATQGELHPKSRQLQRILLSEDHPFELRLVRSR
jgi:hypothetical protein